MFLLTESTLFFLSLALNGRTSKKFSKGGQLKNWAAIVANANGSASSLKTASTTYTPPPTSSGRTTASNVLSQSTAATSVPGSVPATSAKTHEAAAGEIFADDVDEMDERDAMLSRDKGTVAEPQWLSDEMEVSPSLLSLTHYMLMFSQIVINSSDYVTDLEAPGAGSQRPLAVWRYLPKKRKDLPTDVDAFTDSEVEMESPKMDTVVVDDEPSTPIKNREHRTTASVRHDGFYTLELFSLVLGRRLLESLLMRLLALNLRSRRSSSRSLISRPSLRPTPPSILTPRTAGFKTALTAVMSKKPSNLVTSIP